MSDNKTSKFGQRLFDLMKNAGVSRKDVYDFVGIESSSFTTWTKGGGIARENREKLSNLLNVSEIEIEFSKEEIDDLLASRFVKERQEYYNDNHIKEEIINELLSRSKNEIYIIGDNDKFLYVSPVAIKNLGCSMTDMKDKTPYDIKPNLTVEGFKNMKARTIISHDPINFTTEHKRCDSDTYKLKIEFMKIETKLGDVFYIASRIDE